MEINLSIFSQRSMKVFQSALRFVTHMEHGFIGSEHLLWALASDRGAAGRAQGRQIRRARGARRRFFWRGGRKNPRFCFIRKRGFSPAFLCRIRADFSRKPCAFHRVAFSARRSDECVAAGKKAKTKSRRGREKNRRAKREGTP